MPKIDRKVYIGKKIYELPDGYILKHTNKDNFMKIKLIDGQKYIVIVDSQDNLLPFIKHNKILIHNDNTEYRFINLHCKFYPDVEKDNNPFRRVLRLSGWGDKIHKFLQIELPCLREEEIYRDTIKSFIMKRIIRSKSRKLFTIDDLKIKIIKSFYFDVNKNYYATCIWTLSREGEITRSGKCLLSWGYSAKTRQENLFNNKKYKIEKRMRFRNKTFIEKQVTTPPLIEVGASICNS